MGTRLYLVSDFNIDTLARYLENTALPGSTVSVAPYGQVFQQLATPPPDHDAVAVIWTRPEGVIEGFRRARAAEPIDVSAVLDEVRAYAGRITRFAKSFRYTLVAAWTQPSWRRGYGALDFRPGVGVAHLLARMNLTLAEECSSSPSMFLLDAGRWVAGVGARGHSQKQWYATKTPFSAALFEEAALDIAAMVDAAAGTTRRLIVLDLDHVLWDGIVGETGWQALNLGGHDYVGEAFLDFQRELKAFRGRGIQLAIVSKNDEATALEAIDRHPEMHLERGDFAGWRINWLDKAQNIVSLLDELKLGAASAVFIDDSPVERNRIRTALPEVLVPDWPEDPTRYVEALASLRCFDSVALTAEDRDRGSMYVAERARKASLATVGNIDAWLESLGITVTVSRLAAGDLDRAAQLLNKTNQMNLATRRMSPGELARWDAEPGHAVYTFRVSDRFGESGVTGLVGIDIKGSRATLTDFLLSCRVMGRNVEETMLHVAVAHAHAAGALDLVAEYRPTARNAPCLDFFRRSGLRPDGDFTFVWNASNVYERPRSVAVAGAVATAMTDR